MTRQSLKAIKFAKNKPALLVEKDETWKIANKIILHEIIIESFQAKYSAGHWELQWEFPEL